MLVAGFVFVVKVFCSLLSASSLYFQRVYWFSDSCSTGMYSLCVCRGCLVVMEAGEGGGQGRVCCSTRDGLENFA